MASTTGAAAAAARCDQPQCGNAEAADALRPVRLLRCMHTVCDACYVDMAGAPDKRCAAAGCGTRPPAEAHAVWLPAVPDVVRKVDAVPCDNRRCRNAVGGQVAPASHNCPQCVKIVLNAAAGATSGRSASPGKNLCALCVEQHEANDDYAEHTLVELTPNLSGKAAHGLCTMGGCEGHAVRAADRCGTCGAVGCAQCVAAHAGGAHADSVATLDGRLMEAVRAQMAAGGAKAKELDKWFEDYDSGDSAARAPFERAKRHVEEMRRQLVHLAHAKADEELAKIGRLTPAAAAGDAERTALRAHVGKVAARLAHVSSPVYAAKWRAPLRAFVSLGAAAQLDMVKERLDGMPAQRAGDQALEQNKKQLIDGRRVAAIVAKARGALGLAAAAVAAGGDAAPVANLVTPPEEPGELMEAAPPRQEAHEVAHARASSKRPASPTHSDLENGAAAPPAKRRANDAQSCLVCGSVPAEAVRFTCKADGMQCAARMAQAEKRFPPSQHYCFGCHVPRIAAADGIPASGFCSVCDEDGWTTNNDAAAAHLAYLLLLIRSEAKRAPASASGASLLAHYDRLVAEGKCTLEEVKGLAKELGVDEAGLEPPDVAEAAEGGGD